VEIFQQWLLIKIQENFGTGDDPLKNEISFDAVTAMVRPIFEQEGAQLEEDEIRRHLDALLELGYLKKTDAGYFLTLSALVYAQASTTVAQMVRDEIASLVQRHWWKVLGGALLAIILISALVASIVK
jgi:hypothetical protein